MSNPRELLALRREILVARASLQRVAIARDIDTLRGSLRWPLAVASIGASPLARSLVFGALVLIARHGRAARLIGLAATVLAAAKLALALARQAGRPPAEPELPSPPTGTRAPV